MMNPTTDYAWFNREFQSTGSGCNDHWEDWNISQQDRFEKKYKEHRKYTPEEVTRIMNKMRKGLKNKPLTKEIS